MSQSIEVFANSAAAIDAGRRADRPNGLSADTSRSSATDQPLAYSGRQANDAEAIIGELVNQYLRCSTTMSGVFRCW